MLSRSAVLKTASTYTVCIHVFATCRKRQHHTSLESFLFLDPGKHAVASSRYTPFSYLPFVKQLFHFTLSVFSFYHRRARPAWQKWLHFGNSDLHARTRSSCVSIQTFPILGFVFGRLLSWVLTSRWYWGSRTASTTWSAIPVIFTSTPDSQTSL